MQSGGGQRKPRKLLPSHLHRITAISLKQPLGARSLSPRLAASTLPPCSATRFTAGNLNTPCSITPRALSPDISSNVKGHAVAALSVFHPRRITAALGNSNPEFELANFPGTSNTLDSRTEEPRVARLVKLLSKGKR